MATIFDCEIGHEIFDTALGSIHFGNVVMEQYREDFERSTVNISSLMDDSMEERLRDMIERLR